MKYSVHVLHSDVVV